MAFDGLLELDSKGLITAWNSCAERLFGWSRGDVIGQDVKLIVSLRHREAFLSSLSGVVACGSTLVLEGPLPMRALHRDGRRFSTGLFLHPRRSEGDCRIAVFVRKSLLYRRLLEGWRTAGRRPRPDHRQEVSQGRLQDADSSRDREYRAVHARWQHRDH
jgi:PAS domain S-box-containing protein